MTTVTQPLLASMYRQHDLNSRLKIHGEPLALGPQAAILAVVAMEQPQRAIETPRKTGCPKNGTQLHPNAEVQREDKGSQTRGLCIPPRPAGGSRASLLAHATEPTNVWHVSLSERSEMQCYCLVTPANAVVGIKNRPRVFCRTRCTDMCRTS
jgi:hypothetical protein